ncbi:HotDog domain-containing protein [Infundibulicybe gibba]|nr:HotDog domain-containing protein [Infundibulicybe gibba]
MVFLFSRARNLSPTLLRLGVRSKWRETSSISDLQHAFRDPSSPYHIPPGTQGPESPDSPPSSPIQLGTFPESTSDALQEARDKLLAAGFDPTSFWEQPIVWGDLDSFQHVNNVRYVRFFESGRIKWMTSVGHDLGGPEKAEAMVKGRGVSLILKSIEVKFKRPVTYPDTLLVSHKPHRPLTANADPAAFHLTASAYSLAQRAIVAESNEVLVWYDYDKLKKCVPDKHVRDAVWRRVKDV